MIEAVIFDMDGLMIDTERLYFQAWDYAGEKIGIGKAGDMNWKCLGVTDEAAEKIWKQTYGEDFDFPRFLSYAREFFADYFTHHPVPAKKGLRELLEYLKQANIPMAVASSSAEQLVLSHLDSIGVRDFFSVIVCGDMVEHSKPEPDIYLKAASLLHKDPAVCAALEDSRNGLWSAHRAGCQPVMVPDLWQPDEETSAILANKADCLSDLIPWFSKQISAIY